MDNVFNKRFIARFILEAKTPLFVGSGSSGLMKDALVQKDFQGLPMIPGTALTGVLRHAFLDKYDETETSDAYFDLIDIFGKQFKEDKQKNAFEKWFSNKYPGNNRKPDGIGSRLKISAGHFLKGDYKVIDDITIFPEDDLMQRLENLPVRQHVRISHRGAAVKQGLFDNEVVYQGARFIFEMELKGTDADTDAWNQMINQLKSPAFRIGQGTRNGYGSLKVVEEFHRAFDLTDSKDYEDYLNFDPSLNAYLEYNKVSEEDALEKQYKSGHSIKYTLELTPDDFFIFNEGFGDDDVDYKPLTEDVMVYESGKIKFKKVTVIPAASIKGAISHRVCYYYNLHKKQYADFSQGEVGIENKAVAAIFGYESGKDPFGKGKNGKSGKLVMDDIMETNIENDKIFNHVAIDRFTGGYLDGALFSEKVSRKTDGQLTIDMYLLTDEEILEDPDIQISLEHALMDICRGLLPLGGMTTKGNGMFTGKLHKDDVTLFSYS